MHTHETYLLLYSCKHYFKYKEQVPVCYISRRSQNFLKSTHYRWGWYVPYYGFLEFWFALHSLNLFFNKPINIFLLLRRQRFILRITHNWHPSQSFLKISNSICISIDFNSILVNWYCSWILFFVIPFFQSIKHGSLTIPTI